MTSPITIINVRCPHCENVYQAQHRASINLQLDDFDDEYIESMSSAVCSACGTKVCFETLVVQPDGSWQSG